MKMCVCVGGGGGGDKLHGSLKHSFTWAIVHTVESACSNNASGYCYCACRVLFGGGMNECGGHLLGPSPQSEICCQS